MVKYFRFGALLALGLSTSILVADDVPKQGNTHLVLGGKTVVIQSAGAATLDGSKGQLFLVPTGPTNSAFTITASNFKDGQTATVVLENTSTNITRATFGDTGYMVDVQIGRTNVVNLSYSADFGYVTKALTEHGLYRLTTNSPSNWPTNSPTIGGAMIVMSNNVVYLLTSTPTSASWSATNKLAP
jgi:hypothetical protein